MKKQMSEYCSQEQIERYLLNKMLPGEETLFQIHMGSCSTCRARINTLRRLSYLVADEELVYVETPDKEKYKKEKRKKLRFWSVISSIAACIALIIGISVFKHIREVRYTNEYRKNIALARDMVNSSSYNEAASVSLAPQSDVDIDIPRAAVINGETTQDHTYVLIIGNQKYIDNQEVPNAVNDAHVFAEYCYRTFNIPRANTIMLTNATGNQMKEGLQELVRRATHAPQGKADLIVYYSGHGVIAKDRNGMAANDFDQYLIPVDASGADASLSLSRNDIYMAFNAIPFNRASLFLDACNIPYDRAVAKVAKYKWKGNVFVFASSSPNESSISYKNKNHGLFTYYLLKSIKEKNGNIDYKDLTDQVRENVERQSDKMFGEKQTPEVITSLQAGDSWMKWKLFP